LRSEGYDRKEEEADSYHQKSMVLVKREGKTIRLRGGKDFLSSPWEELGIKCNKRDKFDSRRAAGRGNTSCTPRAGKALTKPVKKVISIA